MTCDYCERDDNLVQVKGKTACPDHYPMLKRGKAQPQEVSLVVCQKCGSEVPPAFACIRCGASLSPGR